MSTYVSFLVKCWGLELLQVPMLPAQLSWRSRLFLAMRSFS